MRHQDLPSNFALKIHAILCRRWEKGRDWYDFSWYIRNGVVPNLRLLEAALKQSGPWIGQEIEVNMDWLADTMRDKIDTTAWEDAVADVERFLGPTEREGLALWGKEFFGSRLEKLSAHSSTR